MIQSFKFELDWDNYEIFPRNIWTNPYVVFHGTSSYYSNDIEDKGFLRGFCPFDLNLVTELIRVLQENVPLSEKVASDLDFYVRGQQRAPLRLSFFYRSYTCALYADGSFKGGQIFTHVKEAFNLLKPHMDYLSSSPLTELFNILMQIKSQPGIIYAVQLPNDLEGISAELGVIYSKGNISRDLIIGKVLLPNQLQTPELSLGESRKVNISKINKPGNLGPILYRRYNSED